MYKEFEELSPWKHKMKKHVAITRNIDATSHCYGFEHIEDVTDHVVNGTLERLKKTRLFLTDIGTVDLHEVDTESDKKNDIDDKIAKLHREIRDLESKKRIIK